MVEGQAPNEPTSSAVPSAEERADEPNEAPLGDKDAIFEALWKRTLEAWDDDKPHAALLEHALKSEKLPDLAGRYRSLKDDPSKGARAQKKIDAIVVAATQMLMATKTPPRTKTPWQWTFAATLMFAIVCAWLFYQLMIPHR
ncbi:MAG TPA: hypothetical protein VM580_14820 [Labilithrix sp.]|nr:hypothetical protein [Labilithrix sp.]